jgi:hypothetical protein
MAGSSILSETEVFTITVLDCQLAEEQKILEEYEEHITSDYVPIVLPINTFKRLFNEFQGLLALGRAWTEGEDRKVSELCESLGY